MTTDYAKYLEAVEQVARAAGERILAIYQRGFSVNEKQDGSPLTEADEAAHAAIVEGLASLVPGMPILSEEAAEIPYEQRAGWQRFWLVDPLDGTKEFISRNGEFTVNIALIEQGRPVLGVVYVPVTGVTYLGADEHGAFRRDSAHGLQPIRANAQRAGSLRVVASRSHADDNLRTYLSQLGEHELVSMGSSLKFCLVAEGSADIYPRLGPTMEWDTGAAQCVVEAAGGRIVTLDNQPLRYNKPSLRNPWLFTSGPGQENWTRFAPVPR